MNTRILAVAAVATLAIVAGLLEGLGWLPGARVDTIIGFLFGAGLTAAIYEVRPGASK